ncbi:hypothetical protein KIN20_035801 [Parelaphostrongylus tenuis]|uniref:Uncharacterized protein n=1 Tax=Parelaphostrongylus tenuis TaxID=148309 RepID=A0AAD5RC83_PARTN|nr:hypothetical protein KIN20_035801 [Parelaphostrongylus tenuis]
MDSELIGRALSMRSRELTLEEMLRCPRDETKSIDEYPHVTQWVRGALRRTRGQWFDLALMARQAIHPSGKARLQDLLSEIHKEEQLCEDLMAVKESQSKEIASLSEKIDEKVEFARELLEKKQLLTEKKEAIQCVLSAENVNIAEVLKWKKRVELFGR